MMGVEFKTEGFDELRKNLEQLQKKVEDNSGERQVSFEELFPNSFMGRYTKFGSMQKLIDGYKDDLTEEEFVKLLETQEWENYLKENTKFESWQQMQTVAAEEYYKNLLGF